MGNVSHSRIGSSGAICTSQQQPTDCSPEHRLRRGERSRESVEDLPALLKDGGEARDDVVRTVVGVEDVGGLVDQADVLDGAAVADPHRQGPEKVPVRVRERDNVLPVVRRREVEQGLQAAVVHLQVQGPRGGHPRFQLCAGG